MALPIPGAQSSAVQGINSLRLSVGIPNEDLGTTVIGGNDTDTLFGVRNNANRDMRMQFMAGLTEQKRCYFDWRDPADGSNQWLMGPNASNAFILYDTESTAHRMFLYSDDEGALAGATVIASAGTEAVRINSHQDGGSGTGGLRVFAGGNEESRELAAFTADRSMLTGSDSNISLLLKNNDTDLQTRRWRMALQHRDLTEEPLGIIYAEVTGGNAVVALGGGSGAMNAAREVRCYAGSSTTTPAGTMISKLSDRGLLVDPSGAGTQDTSSALEVTSTTKGFLPPRLTTTERDAIASPATGLTVYNTTTLALESYNGSSWA